MRPSYNRDNPGPDDISQDDIEGICHVWPCPSDDCTQICVDDECFDGLICNEGHCEPLCVKDSNCPEGRICKGERCVTLSSCSDGNEYGPDEVCIEGKCEEEESPIDDPIVSIDKEGQLFFQEVVILSRVLVLYFLFIFLFFGV
jgi:hypothetical protein